MNYFPFHLGDYAAHTGHLEPMEDLAYRRLLDQYYMREGALPADIQTTAKLIRMRSCAADVESVLREFFVLTDVGWTHSRCDEEIEKMQDKQAKARASAAASVNARKAKAERTLHAEATDAERTLPEKAADVELPTPTPTPTPKKNTPLPPKGGFEVPDWIPEKPWADFVAMRRAKGQKIPFTVAAAKGIIAKLDEFRGAGHDVGVILGESVINGWSSVFEPKGKPAARPEAFV